MGNTLTNHLSQNLGGSPMNWILCWHWSEVSTSFWEVLFSWTQWWPWAREAVLKHVPHLPSSCFAQPGGSSRPALSTSEVLSRSYCSNSALVYESESCSVVSNSLRPRGLYSPWNSPGQNTRVGCLSLLQGIFPTQESKRGLLHCRWTFYQLSYQGSPLCFAVNLRL